MNNALKHKTSPYSPPGGGRTFFEVQRSHISEDFDASSQPEEPGTNREDCASSGGKLAENVHASSEANPHRAEYLSTYAQMQAWLTSHEVDQSVTPEHWKVARNLAQDLWCCTNVYAPHSVFTSAVVEGSRKFAELEAERRKHASAL